MSDTNEYKAVLRGAEILIQSSDGAAYTLSVDIINSSLTLRNLWSPSADGEVVLRVPAGLLETWIQCATDTQENICVRDITTLVSYLKVRVCCKLVGESLRLINQFTNPFQTTVHHETAEGAC
jgi:hypothetical protein